jgi:hypothetical protein
MVAFFFYFLIVSTIIAVIASLIYWLKEKKDRHRDNVTSRTMHVKDSARMARDEEDKRC